LTCARKHDSMSTPSKRDVASRSARSRTSSTSRTRNPTHARKDLELVSLVLTQLQHWRCQIIAAACPCPAVCDCHTQPMSQQTPRKLRDSVSVTEQDTRVQRVAEHSIAERETEERAISDGGWRASHTVCTSHTEIPVRKC
jgi:hypothetical protein